MEHRWFRRINAPLDVFIHVGDGQKLHYQVVNISQGGLYIERHASQRFGYIDNKNNAVVYVEINEKSLKATLRALVLRQTPKCAALMFTARHPELRSFLHELKRQEKSANHVHDNKVIEGHFSV